jgi:hypothetical protein
MDYNEKPTAWDDMSRDTRSTLLIVALDRRSKRTTKKEYNEVRFMSVCNWSQLPKATKADLYLLDWDATIAKLAERF